MTAKLPPGTRSEKVEFARNLRSQQLLGQPHVHFPRRARRAVVVGLALLVVATTGWVTMLAASAVSGNKGTAVVWFLLAAQAGLFVVLTYSVGYLTGRNATLDERERAQRDHANALSYRILAVVVATIAFIAVFLNATFGWRPTITPAIGVMPFVLPFVWFVASLPMAVMAWSLPDPDGDTAS